MNIVILLAGGAGTRMEASVAKQHIVVKHHQIIEYTLTAFSQSELIDRIIIVSNPKYLENARKLQRSYPKIWSVCSGGETRVLSVLNGVKCISSFCKEEDKVIISDAVRPCVTLKEINGLIGLLDSHIAATTGLECYETILKTSGEELVQINLRDGLIRQTSPEGYRFKALRWLYLNSTFDIIKSYNNIGIDQLFAAGQKIGIVKSNPLNFKITTQDDLVLFEKVLEKGFFDIINH